MQPNIIVVCVDQMRFDAMACAGNPHIDTPNLDTMARRGNRFTRAYSSTPTCVPARVAMFTGKGPESHGRYGYREGISFPDAYPVTMQGTLREHGYQTFAVGKMHVFPERARCGFDEVLLHDGFLHVSRHRTGGPSSTTDDYVDFLREQTGDPRADYQDTGIGCNAMTARPWEREERLHPTRWVADQSLHFLTRRDPSRPFFLYMSFHRPHGPFDPPAWLWEKYRQMPGPRRAMGDWVERFAEHRRDGDAEAEFARRPERMHQQVRAGYYGNIEFIDQQLNRLNEALSDHGLADNTAIIFTSDHGEMLGDHDLYRKSVAYEGSAHIPFLLQLPPRLQRSWGERGDVEAVVELRDLMPTVLDIADVPVPEGVDGTSVRVAIAQRSDREALREHLQGEHVIGQLGLHSMQWIRTGRWTYIWFSGDGHEQLFDRDTDPLEEHDLAADPAHEEVLRELRGVLTEHLGDREEGFVRDGVLVPGRPVRSEASWVAEYAAF